MGDYYIGVDIGGTFTDFVLMDPGGGLRFGKSLTTPHNPAGLRAAADQLVAEGCESIAICLLHSYVNPEHERLAYALIKQDHPGLHISLSSDVLPEVREFERTSTTALNAYVQPLAHRYLQDLSRRLAGSGFDGSLHIMLASGRLTTVEQAAAVPVSLVESGPAGGAMLGMLYGKLSGEPNLLCFDMGGTTAKACLIQEQQPTITTGFEAARVRRFRKGSGLPIKLPVIDMIEIGAGGGSIAYLDSMGLLQVGPESAGADPGPACYGRGGSRPTVTDADLLLGYLDPDHFLGGEMRLDRAAAATAVQEHLAGPLGIGLTEAALGIHRVVSENMANAARTHLMEKGKDPRQFPMLAFGGAGPVHAAQRVRPCSNRARPCTSRRPGAVASATHPGATRRPSSAIAVRDTSRRRPRQWSTGPFPTACKRRLRLWQRIPRPPAPSPACASWNSVSWWPGLTPPGCWASGAPT